MPSERCTFSTVLGGDFTTCAVLSLSGKGAPFCSCALDSAASIFRIDISLSLAAIGRWVGMGETAAAETLAGGKGVDAGATDAGAAAKDVTGDVRGFPRSQCVD